MSCSSSEYIRVIVKCSVVHVCTVQCSDSFFSVLCVCLGAYIKGRFTQRDLEQRAVLYVIPTDMEVTGDSFEFRVTDPAGNTMLPEM